MPTARSSVVILIVFAVLAPRTGSAAPGPGVVDNPLTDPIKAVRAFGSAYAAELRDRSLDRIEVIRRGFGNSTPPLVPQPICQWHAIGKRVQLVYASIQGQGARPDVLMPLISRIAPAVDEVFDRSAQETGSRRLVRWVYNSNCSLSIRPVVLSPETGGAQGPVLEESVVRTELTGKGFGDPDRKYVIFIDPGSLQIDCYGRGWHRGDDRPTLDNEANIGPSYALVPLCAHYTERDLVWLAAHELMHTLGAVKLSAPNSDRDFHCTDGWDVMCTGESAETDRCPESHRALFDCGHDDYFYAGSPPADNYLASHWNTANSSFLIDTQWPRA